MADTPTHDELSKMKVADLKKLLKAKGLPLTGTKSDLVERLETAAVSTDSPENETETVKEVETEVAENAKEDSTETLDEKPTTVPAQAEDPQTEETPKEPTSPTLITAPESEDDRLKKRAERFGVANEESKKLMRAERFGVVSEDAKKQKRAARFGITEIKSPSQSTGTPIKASEEDMDKLKERAKRFGQVLSSSLSKVDEDEKIKKRKDRFGDVITETNNKPAKFAKITFNDSNSQDDEMKKKRAERFGVSS